MYSNSCISVIDIENILHKKYAVVVICNSNIFYFRDNTRRERGVRKKTCQVFGFSIKTLKIPFGKKFYLGIISIWRNYMFIYKYMYLKLFYKL